MDEQAVDDIDVLREEVAAPDGVIITEGRQGAGDSARHAKRPTDRSR